MAALIAWDVKPHVDTNNPFSSEGFAPSSSLTLDTEEVDLRCLT
ncbi:hypothetical protein (plasmid) [Metabacillus dongyingensis]|nr:hypothetical protein [Metabacillus dongyingensis]